MWVKFGFPLCVAAEIKSLLAHICSSLCGVKDPLCSVRVDNESLQEQTQSAQKGLGQQLCGRKMVFAARTVWNLLKYL